ncbi:MAG: enoyl-CoA hydratase/isomerase family protein [Hyphomicrobiales bacterium]|nr:enoyl-CoA hydratase/isomerase family protein [Hyphomicrobiales bacterium]
MAADADILFYETGRAGVMTLNRPETGNAVTPDLIRDLEIHLLKWARSPKIYGALLEARGEAFCVGRDWQALYELITSGQKETALGHLRDEYQHYWTLQNFIKPHVALINGPMTGSGAGICLYGTHRVAGEAFQFSMPGVALGFFPDAGASYFLPRLPGHVGFYVALCGYVLRAADAYLLGIATHCIPAREFERIEEALASADPIDPFLDSLHRQPGESELAARQPVIDHCFSAASVEEILSRLDAVSDADAGWAQETAASLRRASPVSLKVTLRLLRERPSSLKAALETEFRVASHFYNNPDFIKGLLADLCGNELEHSWSSGSIQNVSSVVTATYFAPLPGAEIDLKSHWTLIE